MRAFNFHYPAETILVAIRLMVHGLTSLRGAVRCFHIFSKFFPGDIPCYVTIQNWVLTFGLYQLTRPNERRDDWIYIVDFTVQLGAQKCLVVLGTTIEQLHGSGYRLTHQDVTVLRIAVTTRTSGDMVEGVLKELALETGVPKQVLSDHGSDVKKGVEMFCAQHEDSVYTYDITHKIGVVLKHLLARDGRWGKFVRLCAQTKRETAQSQAGFLAPPKPKEKSRWLNLDLFVKWAEDVLAWQSKEQFEQINSGYRLSTESFEALRADGLSRLAKALQPMCTIVFPDAEAFIAAAQKISRVPLTESSRKLLLRHGGCGRKISQQYFGWLNDFKDDLHRWRAVLNVVECAKHEVKCSGLSRKTPENFRGRVPAETQETPKAAAVAAELHAFLEQQAGSIPEGETWLGTSDIIESVFGKYKNFSARSALKGIGKMILSMPVFTTQPTAEKIRQAMESQRVQDVRDWLQETLGQTLFSKRKQALGSKRKSRGENDHELLPKVIQI